MSLHNDAYLERIAQDLIRLQFWFEGYTAVRGTSAKLDSTLTSLHQAIQIVREAKSDEHGSKGVQRSTWEPKPGLPWDDSDGEEE